MIFLRLFWEYFKVGLFTIGGGYAMLPMVEQAVERNGWLIRDELINFIGIAESTPGPFAINLATFVGMKVGSSTSLGVFGGFLGAAVATFAVVLPSLVIIMIITKLLVRFRSNRHVQNALYGVRPIVVGLIASAFFTIGGAVVLPKLDYTHVSSEGFSDFRYVSLIIFLAFVPLSRIRIKGKKVHPIWLILLSAGIGILLFGVLGVRQ